MERRSPTGIARERETSADNAAPCQRQAHTAGQSPAKNAYDRSSSSARQWSAGLRPASRGSAKPAPITLRHANVRPTPLGKAQRRTHTTDHRRAREMERRSPTGIARERETSADNAAPCQRQAHTAGQSPAKNAYDRSSSSARTERRSPTGIARERETSADNAAPCQRQAHTAGQSPAKNAYDRSSSSARTERRSPTGIAAAGPRNPSADHLTAHATQVQQVPSVPSVLISDPSVEITTFWSCSASPDFTYHSQRAPSGSVTQVSVFSA